MRPRGSSCLRVGAAIGSIVRDARQLAEFFEGSIVQVEEGETARDTDDVAEELVVGEEEVFKDAPDTPPVHNHACA